MNTAVPEGWRRTAVVGAVLAALLALTPAASATTVSRTGSAVAVTAAAKEANDLTIELRGGVLAVHERGGAARLVVRGGCRIVAGVAECGRGVNALTVNAGDRADRIDAAEARGLAETIRGAAGDDVIVGGPEATVVEAGSGDDLVLIGGGGSDLVSCDAGSEPDGSPGYDTVVADATDEVQGQRAGCEAFELGDLAGFGPLMGVAPLRGGRGATALRLTCPLDAQGGCRGDVRVRSVAGAPVAGGGFALRPGSQRTLRLELDRAARAALARDGRLALRGTVRAFDRRGASRQSSKAFTARR